MNMKMRRDSLLARKGYGRTDSDHEMERKSAARRIKERRSREMRQQSRSSALEPTARHHYTKKLYCKPLQTPRSTMRQTDRQVNELSGSLAELAIDNEQLLDQLPRRSSIIQTANMKLSKAHELENNAAAAKHTRMVSIGKTLLGEVFARLDVSGRGCISADDLRSGLRHVKTRSMANIIDQVPGLAKVIDQAEENPDFLAPRISQEAAGRGSRRAIRRQCSSERGAGFSVQDLHSYVKSTAASEVQKKALVATRKAHKLQKLLNDELQAYNHSLQQERLQEKRATSGAKVTRRKYNTLWDKVTKLEDYLDVYPDDIGWSDRLEEAERNAKHNSSVCKALRTLQRYYKVLKAI